MGKREVFVIWYISTWPRTSPFWPSHLSGTQPEGGLGHLAQSHTEEKRPPPLVRESISKSQSEPCYHGSKSLSAFWVYQNLISVCLFPREPTNNVHLCRRVSLKIETEAKEGVVLSPVSRVGGDAGDTKSSARHLEVTERSEVSPAGVWPGSQKTSPPIQEFTICGDQVWKRGKKTCH